MFEALKEFNSIVVSGPQRSGTRFVAKVITHDTGKIYIDEKEINFHDFRLLDWYLQQGNVVIQCPALCHMLHYITNESVLVIVVRRPVEEIEESERKIGWPEISRFQELYKYGCSEGIISRIKYAFWDKVQKPILLDRGREINYHDLTTHELFIENHESFEWDQTK